MIHDVDGRDKPGHDGNGAVISAILLSAEKAIERALVDRNRGAGNRDICILNT